MSRARATEMEIRTVLAPAAAITDNTAQVGAIIDRQDFESLTFAMTTGTNGDSDASMTVLVEDGDDAALGDAAEVADAQLVGTELGARLNYAADGKTSKIGYKGMKRYVRITVTPTGNTGTIFLSIVAILGDPSSAPKTAQVV